SVVPASRNRFRACKNPVLLFRRRVPIAERSAPVSGRRVLDPKKSVLLFARSFSSSADGSRFCENRYPFWPVARISGTKPSQIFHHHPVNQQHSLIIYMTKAIIDLSGYTGAELSPVAHTIHDTMNANAATFATPPVTMAALQTYIDSFDDKLSKNERRIGRRRRVQHCA